jgi:hypothetical protein
MLGLLVQAHSDEGYAMPRGSLRRWFNRAVSALLQRRR